MFMVVNAIGKEFRSLHPEGSRNLTTHDRQAACYGQVLFAVLTLSYIGPRNAVIIGLIGAVSSFQPAGPYFGWHHVDSRRAYQA